MQLMWLLLTIYYGNVVCFFLRAHGVVRGHACTFVALITSLLLLLCVAGFRPLIVSPRFSFWFHFYYLILKQNIIIRKRLKWLKNKIWSLENDYHYKKNIPFKDQYIYPIYSIISHFFTKSLLSVTKRFVVCRYVNWSISKGCGLKSYNGQKCE